MPLLTEAAEVRHLAAQPRAVGCRVRLEGVVVWVDARRDQFIVEDSSDAITVELRNQPVQVGQRIRLEGKGLAGSDRLREALVDNDGLHPAAEKSAAVYLPAGWQPLRVDWFNGPEEAA